MLHVSCSFWFALHISCRLAFQLAHLSHVRTHMSLTFVRLSENHICSLGLCCFSFCATFYFIFDLSILYVGDLQTRERFDLNQS